LTTKWIGILVGLALSGTSALAQTDQSPPADGELTLPQDCSAAPADQPSGENAPLPDTSKLADCGGVLKPPASADGEMVESPEQGGETPVIPPSQAPADEGTVE
jgi:hypothetical protein